VPESIRDRKDRSPDRARSFAQERNRKPYPRTESSQVYGSPKKKFHSSEGSRFSSSSDTNLKREGARFRSFERDERSDRSTSPDGPKPWGRGKASSFDAGKRPSGFSSRPPREGAWEKRQSFGQDRPRYKAFSRGSSDNAEKKPYERTGEGRESFVKGPRENAFGFKSRFENPRFSEGRSSDRPRSRFSTSEGQRERPWARQEGRASEEGQHHPESDRHTRKFSRPFGDFRSRREDGNGRGRPFKPFERFQSENQGEDTGFKDGGDKPFSGGFRSAGDSRFSRGPSRSFSGARERRPFGGSRSDRGGDFKARFGRPAFRTEEGQDQEGSRFQETSGFRSFGYERSTREGGTGFRSQERSGMDRPPFKRRRGDAAEDRTRLDGQERSHVRKKPYGLDSDRENAFDDAMVWRASEGGVTQEEAEQTKEIKRHVVQKDHGIRLDRWFHRNYPHFPFRQIQEAIRNKTVRLNGHRTTPDQRLVQGDTISLLKTWAERMEAEPPENPFAGLTQAEGEKFLKQSLLVMEDKWVVVHKPEGLPSQGGAGHRRSVDRLVNVALGALDAETTQAFLIHRLDRDTSGVLLLARSADQAALLGDLFKKRDMQKIYHAVLKGHLKDAQGIFSEPLVTALHTGEQIEKPAETAYWVVARTVHEGQPLTWVILAPKTGRKHQIRRHVAHHGYPILGDDKYGGEDSVLAESLSPRLFLHAGELRFMVPEDERVHHYHAPLPEAFIASFQTCAWNTENTAIPELWEVIQAGQPLAAHLFGVIQEEIPTDVLEIQNHTETSTEE